MIHNFILLLVIAGVLFLAKVFCNIFSKAGFPKLYGLLMFLPVINIIALYVLAFSDWPVHRGLR